MQIGLLFVRLQTAANWSSSDLSISVNVYCGLHHHLFEDAFDLDPESNEVLGSLSRPVFWMLRFVSLISTAHHILMKGKYGEENVEASYQLQSMIKFYDNETLKIKQQAQGHLGMAYFRMQLHVTLMKLTGDS